MRCLTTVTVKHNHIMHHTELSIEILLSSSTILIITNVTCTVGKALTTTSLTLPVYLLADEQQHKQVETQKNC